MITRFAPSPTGGLHLGHGWSAILAHDAARAAGGRFILRIEDIDGTRSRAEHVDDILADLAWLGLSWDALFFQSARLADYQAALDRLRAMDLVYPCFCTRAEIAREVAASLSAPHAGAGALYPGTCRHLSAAERAARLGEPHAWRLDMAAATARTGPLSWQDGFAGSVAAAPAQHGDVVLARKDAPASYHLAATVDDAAMGVSDVIRGVDLFGATDIHRLLQALLGLPVPRYHHHALITDGAGRRLAKRDGAARLGERRRRGEDGQALAATLRGFGPLAAATKAPTLPL
ncbi:tRNA glutamyl-Q(34) synthetase GluQRS [Sphingomonas sp.]|uniref:tRNA glutamyl-Q(34) synthetase GluQRS n=1 Tax=Sphingomonas sp. TaxID=28214 RepID=UPI001DCA7B34|nr:tRNA glutamyl-Q(34) synthetase GluQRS [Sphingomonas sp.]MBX9795325.1 tRNA glutamyl-Q(34) synthetase GluQRS [Sphingomonas sp.]